MSSGADGQGTVNFAYEGMNATVLYSKITDSFLPTEIQGESGNLILDRINKIGKVEFVNRIPPSMGQRLSDAREDLTAQFENNEYFYEVDEFVKLVLSGKKESDNNSLENSLITLEIVDEIRKQLGIHYPADSE